MRSDFGGRKKNLFWRQSDRVNFAHARSGFSGPELGAGPLLSQDTPARESGCCTQGITVARTRPDGPARKEAGVVVAPVVHSAMGDNLDGVSVSGRGLG